MGRGVRFGAGEMWFGLRDLGAGDGSAGAEALDLLKDSFGPACPEGSHRAVITKLPFIEFFRSL